MYCAPVTWWLRQRVFLLWLQPLYRRAKRLKKLNRMVQSSIAQAAPNRWRRQTLGLLAAVLVVHIICFSVLTQQISKRYQ